MPKSVARRFTALVAVACVGLVCSAFAPQYAYPVKGAAHVEKDGTKYRAYSDPENHVKNVGGSDGAGLCVFTSIEQTAKLQGLLELEDFQAFMRTRPGGGWPEKVDDMITQKLGPNHGVNYVHVYGDLAIPILEQVIEEGYYPCVTYGYGERYGVSIAHMVNLSEFDALTGAVQDNNFPGTWEEMPREEFIERFHWSTNGKGQGWAIVFLDNPQPPRPKR